MVTDWCPDCGLWHDAFSDCTLYRSAIVDRNMNEPEQPPKPAPWPIGTNVFIPNFTGPLVITFVRLESIKDENGCPLYSEFHCSAQQAAD